MLGAGLAFPSVDESQRSFALAELFDDGRVASACGIPGWDFAAPAMPVFESAALESFILLWIGNGETFDVDQVFVSVAAAAAAAGGSGGTVPEQVSLPLVPAGLAALGTMRRAVQATACARPHTDDVPAGHARVRVRRRAR